MAKSKAAKPNGTPRNETLMALRNELEAFGEALDRTRDRAVELEGRPGVRQQEDIHRAIVEIARSVDSARRAVDRALKIAKNT
ncbi:MAG: hypothetical protein FJW44_09455 [Actinobacteria bacterium]|nr:hypothetical protein [Actinomycetota bacterium]